MPVITKFKLRRCRVKKTEKLCFMQNGNMVIMDLSDVDISFNEEGLLEFKIKPKVNRLHKMLYHKSKSL